MPTLTKISQRDERWANIKLGTSNLTIGQAGCTITCIAMLADLTPDDVNNRLKVANGYANTNLVIWSKIKEAISWLEFEWRGYSYENTKVASAISKNGSCLVEVDGTPIGGSKHWVLYIGNQKLIDPWDGKEKSTSSYQAIGYAIINKIGNKPEGNNMSEYEEAIRKSSAYDEVCKLLDQPTTTSAKDTLDKLSKIISDKERYKQERDNALDENNTYARKIELLTKEKQEQAVQIKDLQDSITSLNNELEDCQNQVPAEEDLEKDYEATGRKIIRKIGDVTIETSYKKEG